MKKSYWPLFFALLLLVAITIVNASKGGPFKYYVAYIFTDYKQKLISFGENNNIKIVYTVDDSFIDKSLLGVNLENSAETISNFELARYSILLPELVSKYPAEVIKKDLKVIKLSSSLTLYGVSYGGTSIGSTLYLTSTGLDNGYTDIYIEELFHHEFSSILMRTYLFPEAEFAKLNPLKFQYAQNVDDILNSIINDKNTTGNEALYKNGFLTKYSMSTLENDVNMFAEHIFTKPSLLKNIINKYPLIKNKYSVVKQFYLGIDSRFTSVFGK